MIGQSNQRHVHIIQSQIIPNVQSPRGAMEEKKLIQAVRAYACRARQVTSPTKTSGDGKRVEGGCASG